MMDKKALNQFLKKFADNSYTDQEHQLFIEWLNSAPVEKVQEILDEYEHILETKPKAEAIELEWLSQTIEGALNGHDENPVVTVKKLFPWLKIAMSAAAVLFVGTMAILFLTHRSLDNPATLKQDRIVTAKPQNFDNNKAVLTTADGSKIVLTNTIKNMVASSGLRIGRTDNGQITFTSTGTKGGFLQNAFNTVTTPRNGQYNIILPDGSTVWLNAESSLKFPTSFSDKGRSVELIGEGYFEVAKVMAISKNGQKARLPFIVTSGNQTVEVLGTHFNINAYPEEPAINTTLLEGSVKVTQTETSESKLLVPGQQAKVGNGIRVSDVDAMQSIAWKDGYFVFSHENIKSIMRKISRWYDVEIKYEGNITQEGFTGSMSRFKDVSDVLKTLQGTGLAHFKMEEKMLGSGRTERRITVMP